MAVSVFGPGWSVTRRLQAPSAPTGTAAPSRVSVGALLLSVARPTTSTSAERTVAPSAGAVISSAGGTHRSSTSDAKLTRSARVVARAYTWRRVASPPAGTVSVVGTEKAVGSTKLISPT